jgi:hypothetical protein
LDNRKIHRLSVIIEAAADEQASSGSPVAAQHDEDFCPVRDEVIVAARLGSPKSWQFIARNTSKKRSVLQGTV